MMLIHRLTDRMRLWRERGSKGARHLMKAIGMVVKVTKRCPKTVSLTQRPGQLRFRQGLTLDRSHDRVALVQQKTRLWS